jgi:hypothetical protein
MFPLLDAPNGTFSNLEETFSCPGNNVQWNLYKAEPHGTENIFHIGQISAIIQNK